jgi:hypothetical protein
MSLLEWSPATHSVTTVSIHYYERDEFKVSKSPLIDKSPITIKHPIQMWHTETKSLTILKI